MTYHNSGAIKQCLPLFVEKYRETTLNQLPKIITGKNRILCEIYDTVKHSHRSREFTRLTEKLCNGIIKTSVTKVTNRRTISFQWQLLHWIWSNYNFSNLTGKSSWTIKQLTASHENCPKEFMEKRSYTKLYTKLRVTKMPQMVFIIWPSHQHSNGRRSRIRNVKVATVNSILIKLYILYIFPAEKKSLLYQEGLPTRYSKFTFRDVLTNTFCVSYFPFSCQ